jgi:hypothetical protein
MPSDQSAYLKPNRLSDLLAAIQAMGSNENYRRTCEQWVRIISGRETPTEDPIDDQTDDQTVDKTVDPTDDPTDDQTDDPTDDQTNYWKNVFNDHPEFFRRARMSGGGKERYSLIWRRALPLAHMENANQILSRDYKQLPLLEKKAYWRPQLADSSVQALMDIAIKMHARAVEDKHAWRFWLPSVMSLVGSLAGAGIAFVGVWLFHVSKI